MDKLGLDFTLAGPRQLPLEVARDTFLIRAVTPSVGGSWTNLNSMVIAGAEPIIVIPSLQIVFACKCKNALSFADAVANIYTYLRLIVEAHASS